METQISDPTVDNVTTSDHNIEQSGSHADLMAEMTRLRTDFESRLIVADLRTEAVKAGMLDLDGLKLINLSEVKLGPNDNVVDSQQIMENLRRQKPWLFGATSSSSPASAPTSQPPRRKSALDMTNEEYAAARAAVTKKYY